ncbi:MAG: hypothetical protein Q8O13_01310, partial [Candidatus Omnitrophota bacterium]|nr:hypothetical protein [Candidatus Omnitrophota bacterium]
MKTIIVIIILSLCSFSNSYIFAIEPSIDVSDLKKSISERNYYQEEYEIIDNIQFEIKYDPDNYANYTALAFYCNYVGLYAKALEAIKLQIKYAPENGYWDIIYGNLAKTYMDLGRIDEAKKPILKSLKYNPENIIDHVHLLNFYVLKKQYKEAASEFKVLSGLDKDKDFYHDVYKWRVGNDKDSKDMVPLFEETVKINPDSYLAHRVLGVALRDSSKDIKKDLPVVMKSLNKALELNPKYVPTYIAIANTYMYMAIATKKKAYYNDSLRWLGKAHKLDP